MQKDLTDMKIFQSIYYDQILNELSPVTQHCY